MAGPCAYYKPGFIKEAGGTVTLKLTDVPAGHYYVRILELDSFEARGCTIREGLGRNDLLDEFRVEVEVVQVKGENCSRFKSVTSEPPKIRLEGWSGSAPSLTEFQLVFDGLPDAKHKVLVYEDLDDFDFFETASGLGGDQAEVQDAARRYLEIGVELVRSDGQRAFLSKAPCWIPKPQGRFIAFSTADGLPFSGMQVQRDPTEDLVSALNLSSFQYINGELVPETQKYVLDVRDPWKRLDFFLRGEADDELEALQKAPLLGIGLRVSASLTFQTPQPQLRILPQQECALELVYAPQEKCWTARLHAESNTVRLEAVRFDGYNVIRARFTAVHGEQGRLLLVLNRNWAAGFYGFGEGPLRFGLGGNVTISNLDGVATELLLKGYVPFDTIVKTEAGSFQRLVVEQDDDAPPRMEQPRRLGRVVVPPPEHVEVYLEVSWPDGTNPGELAFHFEGTRAGRHVRGTLAGELTRVGEQLKDLGSQGGVRRYRFRLPRSEPLVYHLTLEDAGYRGIRTQGNRLLVSDEVSLAWIIHFRLDHARLEQARQWAPRIWFSGYAPQADLASSYESHYPRSYWSILAHRDRSKIPGPYLRKYLYSDGRLALPHHACIPLADPEAAFDRVGFAESPHQKQPVVVYANTGQWQRRGFAQYYMMFTQSASTGFEAGNGYDPSALHNALINIASHHEGDTEIVSYEDPAVPGSISTCGAHYHASARPMKDVVCFGDDARREPLVTIALRGHGTFPVPTHCRANADRHRREGLAGQVAYSYDLAGGQHTELRAQCVAPESDAGYTIELLDEESPWLQYKGRWGAHPSKCPQGPLHRDTMNPVDSDFAEAHLAGVLQPRYWADADGSHRSMREYAMRMPDTSLLARRDGDSIDLYYYVGGTDGAAQLTLLGGTWAWAVREDPQAKTEEDSQAAPVPGSRSRVRIRLQGEACTAQGWHRVRFPVAWALNLSWRRQKGRYATAKAPPRVPPDERSEHFALELHFERPYCLKPAIDSKLRYYFVEGRSSSPERVRRVAEKLAGLPGLHDHDALGEDALDLQYKQ